MKRVILLGGSGFVGRALSEALVSGGTEVHGFSSTTLDLRVQESLTTLDSLAGPDTTLIVLASLTPDKGVTLETFMHNVDMTRNVAEYIIHHDLRKLVFFSSDAVYGFDFPTVSERTAVEPDNHYALAKYTSEQLLTYAARSAQLPLLVLRPTAIYGPGDTHGSYGPNRFVRAVSRGEPVRLFGQGEEQRDHLFIDDAVALTVALSADDTTGIYNLASGVSSSFGDVVRTLRQLVGAEVVVEEMPRRGTITHRHFDISKLRSRLPEFAFTPLESGLRASLSAVQQHQQHA